METETRAAADLRRDVEESSRKLESKQYQLKALYDAAKNAEGKWAVEPHQADQIRSLESETARMIEGVNALKLEYCKAKNEENLDRLKGDSFGGAAIWPGEGGQAADAADAEAVKTIGRLPASLGEAFVASQAYKSWVHGGQNQAAHVEVPALGARHYAFKSIAEAAMKTTLTTSTGPFTSYDRPPGVIELGQQMLTVADLFAQAQTTAPVIRYIQEDAFTNAADTVLEEGLKPEAAWDLSEVDSPVRKIAVLTRVTDETFQDFPQIRDYINDRLPFMVRQKEEFQLLSGDGNAPNILGVLSNTGILTQAKSTFSNADAIYLGITKVRTQGFFEPDAVVIDPTNWTPIRLLKTTTGEYVWGDPSVAGPETIFGKRVVVTANMVDNTALVGAFRIGGTVYYRQGLRVEATNSDASDFSYNRIALRAEIREALAIWRPKGFCKVTGLDAA